MSTKRHMGIKSDTLPADAKPLLTQTSKLRERAMIARVMADGGFRWAEQVQGRVVWHGRAM